MEENKNYGGGKKLTCVFCKGEIPDESVASPAWPVKDGYCCIECYVYQVMPAKICEEMRQVENKKKGRISSEKRVFGKKNYDTPKDEEEQQE